VCYDLRDINMYITNVSRYYDNLYGFQNYDDFCYHIPIINLIFSFVYKWSFLTDAKFTK